ncbi:hypothetical protein B835_1752 [Enterococcus mundtii 3F]|uniref:Uncharacterized protein n=1 Tax=Enterococcus mundtii TaxID=53346 RepID=A0A2T5DC18_ENTMU|nr:hypothetical protein [Enterococcus mundtii]MDA9461825.1 hypothetical protein [Enterococcus mundtii 3F]PTO35223.1 hypothetical protein C6N14_08485 [Enterococcus mundtii]PTO39019.1 hypothetical protein C6P52_06800 [Enterococcus mundtii]PTO44819.1 hypothetical protein C6P54_02700 [Enterococcus mundtii]
MSKIKRRNQQKKRRKNGVLLLFVSLMVMAVASWYWFGHKEPIPVISADLLPEISDASDQRISERAQELADANYFTLQINPEAVFENGRSRGSIEIVNPGTNVYPIAVDITINDTKEVIYSSGAIYPNQLIEGVYLKRPLEKGEYPATATVNIYDPETKEKQGVTEAEISILIKN